MAFLSVVVKVIGKRIVDSKSALRAYHERYQLSQPPLSITPGPKKFFVCCPRAVMPKSRDPCELGPAVPSPPHATSTGTAGPARILRTSRFPASMPTHPPPQSSEVRRLVPTASPLAGVKRRQRLARPLLLSDRHFSSAVWAGFRLVSQAADRISHRAKTRAVKHLKSSNFNWFSRQFYYALNTWRGFRRKLRINAFYTSYKLCSMLATWRTGRIMRPTAVYLKAPSAHQSLRTSIFTNSISS